MMHGPLFVDPKEIPAGFDYQWVAETVMGDDALGDYPRQKNMGWRDVPPERHPHFPSDGKRIVHGGLVLVERPLVLSQRAKLEERDKADAQMGYARGERSIGSPDSLPEDDRGIDEGREIPIISHWEVRDGSYTWTDQLTCGLWFSGWRYVPADRHVEFFAATKDPKRKRVLFFDAGSPRYLIARKSRNMPHPYRISRPGTDWLQRLMFWRR